ncbi:hypothetical protein CMESO_296 (nucleomorph) [Chroomonas mesostigmatica CCMP1168]|uniref:Uncharacterized protein n=1 Tax=Chroomonas mesostigmatica CCMP1168 TaxID=1195612 RepID=J7G5W9_9CRYP|nr:hypothetical protein CMESO_296 [Chroomonas mesostigmatica CCMP1168]
MHFQKSPTNLKNPFDFRGFFGISTGCFCGSGYGFIIGFGRQFYSGSGVCLVYPSRNPFAHSGYLNGCYCGVMVGLGLGSGMTCDFGVEKKIDNPVVRVIKIFSKNDNTV